MRPLCAECKLYASLLLLLCLCMSSCEKEVHIDLPSAEPQLVVDGFIETNQPPVVVLTKSIGYFAKIDLSNFVNSFVHDAVITVDDGVSTVTLKEYALDTGGSFRFYVYSLDSADQHSFSFLGKVNTTYKLTITADGKTYESTTRIPDCKPIDSLAALVPDRPDPNLPARRLLNVFYTDPDTPGNCIRYFTRRNSEPFYTADNSVYDDGLVNGAVSARLPLFLGYDRNTKTNDTTGYLFPGDTVTLKWCAIERPVFNFYTTLEYSVTNTGNPFTSPINVRTNISNGALGIWAGYGTTYATLVVKE